MKKILLVGALAIATIVNANSFNPIQVQKVKMDGSAVKKIELSGAATSKEVNFSERKAVRAAQAQYAGVDHYFTDGEFHNGFGAGMMGFSFAAIVLPYMDSVTYTNIYGATDWYENGKLEAQNSATYTTSYGFIPDGYIGYVPETKDHTFTYQGTDYNIKGTTYGNTASAAYLFSGEVEHPEMLGGSNIPMTLCAMHCDTLEDTHDYWRVGGGLTGDPYFNGTGIHLDSADRVTTADTMGIIVDFAGTMKFDSIILTVYSDGAGNDSILIPADAQINVNIFPLTANGINFNDTIASTVITHDNFEGEVASWGVYGTLTAKFYDIDIFGTQTPMPVYAKDGFFVEFTNYNESGCNFGFFSDYDNPITGTTVYKYKNQWQYRGHTRTGGGQYGQNLLISFDGYFPGLVNDTTCNELIAEVEGGYAHFSDDLQNVGVWLLSNVNYEEWEVETEAEWVAPVIASTDYWESASAIAIAFEAEELPEGVSGRTATIDIIADGAVQTFTIYQGTDAPQGVENTKVDGKFSNKSYDVLGREIKDENFKGVVIRNGQKTLVK